MGIVALYTNVVKSAYSFTKLTAAMYYSWNKQYHDKFELLQEGSIDVLRQTYG